MPERRVYAASWLILRICLSNRRLDRTRDRACCDRGGAGGRRRQLGTAARRHGGKVDRVLQRETRDGARTSVGTLSPAGGVLATSPRSPLSGERDSEPRKWAPGMRTVSCTALYLGQKQAKDSLLTRPLSAEPARCERRSPGAVGARPVLVTHRATCRVATRIGSRPNCTYCFRPLPRRRACF